MNNTTKEKFLKSLYSEHSIPDVLSSFAEELEATDNIIEIAHAKKIREYRRLIVNKKFLAFIRRTFNELYQLIDKKYPSVLFTMDGRRKALISTEKKILNLISANKSLDLLRDIFAFRIIIFGNNSEETIKTCYEIAISCIVHFISRGFTLCEADPVNGTDFDPKIHPQVLIPDKSEIPEAFKTGVKDYILTPKANGYQSIHITFRSPSGECFEIQFRTFDMHIYAEGGNAGHDKYKADKYSAEYIDIDPTRINIPGYGYVNGQCFDFIGLIKALEILKRTKTH